MAALPQAAKPELGVLFVHGIGEQRQGQTLVAFADPISRWLARWLSEGRQTEADLATPAVARVAVGETTLGGDDPAHLTLTIDTAGDLGLPGRHRWLLAESWWAETFQPPKTRALLLWLLLILPYMILLQFCEQLVRGWRHKPPDAWPRGLAALIKGARLIVFGIAYICALPLAAVGAAFALVLLVAILIPIPQISDRAKHVALLLSNTLGDSFVLASSSVQFDAMVSRVARDLRWLSRRAKRVVVVAHSQGTAVAYAAIDSGPTPWNLRSFVTVGEAIKKLGLVRALQSYGTPRGALPVAPPERRTLGDRVGSLEDALGRFFRLRSMRFVIAWAGLIGLAAVAYALPQVLVLGLAQSTGSVEAGLILGLGAGFMGLALLVCLTCWIGDIVRDPDPLGPDGAPLHWADFYASSDPVSNGPLFTDTDGKDWLLEKQVWNFASVLRDHTTYTSSEDDFLGCVVGVLVGASGNEVPEATHTMLTHGRWRGWWRVWWLKFGRTMAGVAAVATVVCVRKQLPDLGHRVAHWHWGPLKPAGKWAIDRLSSLIIVGHLTNDQIVGALTVVLVGAAGYVVLSAAWSYWQRQDVKRFYQRGAAGADSDPLGGREFILYVLVLAAEGFIAAVIDLSGDYAAVWNWSTQHPWPVVAIVVGCVIVLPVVLGWLLRDLLRLLESRLVGLFPRDGDGGPPAAEVPAAPALPVQP